MRILSLITTVNTVRFVSADHIVSIEHAAHGAIVRLSNGDVLNVCHHLDSIIDMMNAEYFDVPQLADTADKD